MKDDDRAEVSSWLKLGEPAGLRVMARGRRSGESVPLEREALEELLTRLLAYERALAARDHVRARAAAESIAELGADPDWFEKAQGAALFTGTRDGREVSGNTLRELLNFCRGTALVDPKERLVFIVDDDDALRDLMDAMVSREGFRTEVFPGASELEEALAARRPHLILLDLMMPGRSGVELLRQLQAGDGHDIPIVIVTARAMDSAFIEELRAERNVAEFLKKPVQPKRLTGLLHGLLGTRPAEG